MRNFVLVRLYTMWIMPVLQISLFKRETRNLTPFNSTHFVEYLVSKNFLWRGAVRKMFACFSSLPSGGYTANQVVFKTSLPC